MISNDDIDKLQTILATKNDLKLFATKQDLQVLENKFDQKLDKHTDKISEQLTQFRSDIFDKLDQVIGELKTNREEREVMAHQISDHESRIETIESKLALTT